jgi:hypothetical protein
MPAERATWIGQQATPRPEQHADTQRDRGDCVGGAGVRFGLYETHKSTERGDAGTIPLVATTPLPPTSR